MAKSNKKNVSNNSQYIIKFHNDFNALNYSSFKSVEFDMFLSICTAIKEHGTNAVALSFDYLKDLSEYDVHDNKRFVDYLLSLNQKLIGLSSLTVNENGVYEQKPIFENFKTDPNNKTLTVALREDTAYLLNNFNSQYTVGELKKIVSLSSIKSKIFALKLLQFKSTGMYIVPLEEFYKYMGINKDAEFKTVNRDVLKPLIASLQDDFKDLALETIKDSPEDKRKVSKLKFTFAKKRDSINYYAEDGAEFDENGYISQVCFIFNYNYEKLTHAEIKIIEEWRDDLKVSTDLVKAAKYIANEKANIRYCNGILKSWSQQGYVYPVDVPDLVESGFPLYTHDVMQDSMFDVPDFEDLDK